MKRSIFIWIDSFVATTLSPLKLLVGHFYPIGCHFDVDADAVVDVDDVDDDDVDVVGPLRDGKETTKTGLFQKRWQLLLAIITICWPGFFSKVGKNGFVFFFFFASPFLLKKTLLSLPFQTRCGLRCCCCCCCCWVKLWRWVAYGRGRTAWKSDSCKIERIEYFIWYY